jgi:tyrosinase
MNMETTSETGSGSSRFQRIQAILDDAAGQSASSYQGSGRFWHLPLPELLELSVYGVRMIAPKQGPATGGSTHDGCCNHGVSSWPSGRGAASGLVRGLRGAFPFDGTQFPPLPWGGRRVTESDIQFIEQWIDDDCPDAAADHTAAANADRLPPRALAAGEAAHPAHVGPTNQALSDSGALKQRKNIVSLSDDEWHRLRAAIAQMKSLDNYYQDERSFAYWARIHANQCQHGWEEFLTWHRAYLYFFELRLQDVDPTVTLPYWDWTADAANVVISMQDSTEKFGLDNGIIPAPYRCWVDAAAVDHLAAGGQVPQPVLTGLHRIIGQPFDSGWRLFAAAGITYGDNPASDTAIKAELERVNTLFHWNRWPGGNSSLIFEAYPTPGDVEDILEIQNFFAFASGSTNDRFFGALENIHNLIHNYTGGVNPYYATGRPLVDAQPFTGDMVNAGVTAFDPIFWAHHANVDRLWAEWQHRNPNVGPDDPDAVLPPWNLTVADTASIRKLGYEYAMATHVFPTDASRPLVLFRSAAAAPRPAVLANHKRAEIRLHGVQQVARPGFFIRAFLNTPDAGIATQTKGNDHYVGQANMFTGLCVGGLGHCDVPPPSQNKFDLRPPHHKTASSFRFDASNAVRQLTAAGVTDFAVNLVVLNLDGTLATDALRLDAVSLSFID